jgi:hypothetical protein
MQSEKPRVAKKAEENKLMAKATPTQSSYMAIKKKEDQAVSAKLGSEPVDGVGSGAYSEFLHEWCENLTAKYTPVGDCVPVFNVTYENGHILGTEPANSCGVGAAQAFAAAMDAAVRPPMPTSLGNQQITFIFYAPPRH